MQFIRKLFGLKPLGPLGRLTFHGAGTKGYWKGSAKLVDEQVKLVVFAGSEGPSELQVQRVGTAIANFAKARSAVLERMSKRKAFTGVPLEDISKCLFADQLSLQGSNSPHPELWSLVFSQNHPTDVDASWIVAADFKGSTLNHLEVRRD